MSVLFDTSDDVTQAGEYWHGHGLYFGEYQILHRLGQFLFDVLFSPKGYQSIEHLLSEVCLLLV